MYQVGALKAFLDEQDMPLNHIKPHGALYMMAARDEDVARAVADAVAVFNVSIFGMVNTCHEKIYKYERSNSTNQRCDKQNKRKFKRKFL